MNVTPTDSPVVRLNLLSQKIESSQAPQPRDTGRWPLQRWLLFVALTFIAHVAAIFIFGQHKFLPARAVKNVPQLQLADDASPLIALDDPTLFAQPHAEDFALLKTSEVKPPSFRWTEAPRWLSLPVEQLGATFSQFMRTNSFGTLQMDFKPPMKFSTPAFVLQPAFAENSTLQLQGGLALRELREKILLPNWPRNDIIAPSKVQALVNAEGDVVSAILLPSNNPLKAENRDAAADQRALEIARAARFLPAPHLTVGMIIFNWQTVPPPVTNSPANP